MMDRSLPLRIAWIRGSSLATSCIQRGRALGLPEPREITHLRHTARLESS